MRENGQLWQYCNLTRFETSPHRFHPDPTKFSSILRITLVYTRLICLRWSFCFADLSTMLAQLSSQQQTITNRSYMCQVNNNKLLYFFYTILYIFELPDETLYTNHQATFIAYCRRFYLVVTARRLQIYKFFISKTIKIFTSEIDRPLFVFSHPHC